MGNKLSGLKARTKKQWDHAAFKLTASKELGKRIWSSFGAWDELLNLLEPQQCLELQAANKFCYNVAVSRVVVKISLRYPLYFTLADSIVMKDKLDLDEDTPDKLVKVSASLSQSSIIVTEQVQTFNLSWWLSVQIGNDLLQVHNLFNDCRLLLKRPG